MKKAGLPTGNRGYTLFEVLVTVAVLSVGLIYLFPAFFGSGTVLTTLNTRYEAGLAADNLLADIEKHLTRKGRLRPWPSRGEASAGTRVFSYETDIRPVFIFRRVKTAEQSFVYQVDARVFWKDGHSGQIERSTYVVR